MATWMIVEDEPDLYEMLRSIPEALDWDIDGITGFVTGEDGIAWIEDVDDGRHSGELPELALLDIRLPGQITGLDIGERIRRSPKLQHIAIILVTAFRMSPREENEIMRRSGADRLLYKPLPSLSELQAILEKTLASHSPSRPTVKSMVNQGNEVKTDIKRQSPSPVASMPLPEVQTGQSLTNKESKKPLIMMVDDDIDSLKLIGLMLQRQGCEIISANGGIPALRILDASERLPDLIVLDVMMPDLSGYEVVKRIRANPRLNHLPVIMFTAKTHVDDKIEGFWSGADDYLTKPTHPQELYSRIKSMLARHSDLGARRNKQPYVYTKILRIKSEDLRAGHAFQLIADQRPDAIVIRTGLSLDVGVLRDFALSAHIPIIVDVESKSKLEFDDWLEMVNAGADEVFNTDFDIGMAAVQTAVKQYADPALERTGQAWHVLIAGPDFDRRSDVADMIEPIFYSYVTDADTRELCLDIAYNEAPNVLIIDDALGDLTLVRELRQIGISAPIILLTEDNTTLTTEHYALQIRGIVPYDRVQDGLIPTINRLLFWNRELRSLHESWSHYRLHVTEASFEQRMRENMPVIAATLEEASLLFSGLIHDLRNAIYSLLSQLEDVADEQRTELQPAVEATSLLLETLAEARFKGTWNVSELDAAEMRDLIGEAVALAQTLNLETKVEVGNIELTEHVYLVDRRQVCQIVADMLLAISEYATTLTITMDKHTIAIHGKGVERFSIQANELSALMPETLYALAAIKLSWRMGLSLRRIGGSLRLGFKIGGWEDEAKLRQDIAHDAQVIASMQTADSESPKIEVEPQLVALVTPIAVRLVHLVQHIVERAVEIRPKAEQIVIKARYTLLLALDLLTTCSGYKAKPQAVQLQPLLDTLYKLRKDYLQHCVVDFAVAPGTPPVYADELALLQILVNLVTNAVEAVGGRGRISVRAAPHEKGVEIRISDNGPGISTEQQAKIFDLFYTTKPGHERGVGLHIVRSIIDELGGEITIDSMVGRGTTFSLTIPASETNANGN